jgi:hypothetical protein
MTDFETMQAEVARLTAEVADLMARVTHLEESGEGGHAARTFPVPAPHRAEYHELPAAAPPTVDKDAVQGTITYRGSVRTGVTALDYEVSHPVANLLGLDEVALARILAVVSSPARLTVLRTLLEGPGDSDRLRRAVGRVAGDQFERDLDDLIGAGLIVQPRPGFFEAVPERAVPLLTLLAAANDLGGPAAPGPFRGP